jgi:hypothetical protein
VLINEMPRYEILDESSMQELERGWRRSDRSRETK